MHRVLAIPKDFFFSDLSSLLLLNDILLLQYYK